MREALTRLTPVMDFSNLPKDDPLYDPRRQNVAGFMKLETDINDPVVRFVGLRAKTYAFETKKSKMESRCKGVKKAVKKNIRFESFLRCVESKNLEYITQYSIMSKDHVNRLVSVNKVAFSSYEEKRFLLCAIHSVPYGSILIRQFYDSGQKCFMCENPYLLI